MKISVSVEVNAPVAKAWEAYTSPEAINQWNFASDDWQCRDARVDLRVGGGFSSHMEAKDGSFGFDFEGVYDHVEEHKRISYSMSDGRKVKITFAQDGTNTKVTVVFDPEHENPIDMQRQGWQAILDNFKKHVEE